MQSPVSRSRAVLAFTLGCAFFAYAFMQRVAPSVMTTELMLDFSVGATALGALSGWYFYTYALIQLPVGILTDRFGPRKLMSIAMLLCGVASLGLALSDSLLWASLSRALIGATLGFGFVGTLAIAGYWFGAARFAMLAGVVQAVGMCGAILGQAPLRLAVEQFGWRGTMLGLATSAVVLAGLLFAIIPKRAPAVLRKSSRRTDTAFAGLKSVVYNRQSWLCAGIGFGAFSLILGFAGLWAVPWLSYSLGFSKPQAAAMASSIFFGWAVGSPLFGWLSDRLGRRKPLILCGSVLHSAAFGVLIYGGVTDTLALVGLFMLCGLSGCSVTGVFSAVRELNNPRDSATALGLVNMCIIGSGAMMQPLVGWLLDWQWQGQWLADGSHAYTPQAYSVAFSAFLLATLLALVCTLGLRETHCKPQAA